MLVMINATFVLDLITLTVNFSIPVKWRLILVIIFSNESQWGIEGWQFHWECRYTTDLKSYYNNVYRNMRLVWHMCEVTHTCVTRNWYIYIYIYILVPSNTCMSRESLHSIPLIALGEQKRVPDQDKSSNLSTICYRPLVLVGVDNKLRS